MDPPMQWPNPNRNLLLCCVRLSAEKQPNTFVAVAAALSRRGTFQKLNLQPVLLAASSSHYAQVWNPATYASALKGPGSH